MPSTVQDPPTPLITEQETPKWKPEPAMFKLHHDGSEFMHEVCLRIGHYAFPTHPPRLLVQAVDPFTKNIYGTLSDNFPDQPPLEPGQFYAKHGEEPILDQLVDVDAIKVVREGNGEIPKIMELQVPLNRCVRFEWDGQNEEEEEENAKLVEEELKRLETLVKKHDAKRNTLIEITKTSHELDKLSM